MVFMESRKINILITTINKTKQLGNLKKIITIGNILHGKKGALSLCFMTYYNFITKMNWSRIYKHL